MKKSAIMNTLFKLDSAARDTPMDRTAAAARDIVDSAAQSRAEKTERLRALRREQEQKHGPVEKKKPTKR